MSCVGAKHFIDMKHVTQFPEDASLSGLSRVKFGIDPTRDRLHLGHMVPLRIARKLQQQGKHLTLVLGTFTAQMGDPSGQDQTRPILSREQVEANAEKLLEQASKILLPGFEVFRNGDLFNPMTVPELMRLVSRFSVQFMTSRDSFRARLDRNQPIAMHELLVPVLQGQDSVHLKAEIEIGGQDQLFNFSLARRMQQSEGQAPQVSLMTPIIRGTDGRKMSKSFGNCIFLDGTAGSMFGLCMSVSDVVMDEEFIPLLTDMKRPPKSPMERKKKMAHEIVKQIHGKAAADRAQATFEREVQQKETPEDIPTIEAEDLIQAVVTVRDCSNSAARRLIQEGGVRVEGVRVFENQELTSGVKVQIGRRVFVEVV